MGLFDKIIGKQAAKAGAGPHGLVVYDSRTGNAEKMALAIGVGMQQNGVNTEVKRVEKTTMNDLLAADVIVMGSPTYFANMTMKMKDFIDKTIKLYADRQLADKAGAVFTTCAGVGGDMTALAFVQTMLLHSMVVIGPETGGLGLVQVGDADEKCINDCHAFGARIAAFTDTMQAGIEKISQG